MSWLSDNRYLKEPISGDNIVEVEAETEAEVEAEAEANLHVREEVREIAPGHIVRIVERRFDPINNVAIVENILTEEQRATIRRAFEDNNGNLRRHAIEDLTNIILETMIDNNAPEADIALLLERFETGNDDPVADVLRRL